MESHSDSVESMGRNLLLFRDEARFPTSKTILVQWKKSFKSFQINPNNLIFVVLSKFKWEGMWNS